LRPACLIGSNATFGRALAAGVVLKRLVKELDHELLILSRHFFQCFQPLLQIYRWSSYRAYVGYEGAEPWLKMEDLLKRAGGQEDEQARRYGRDVKNMLRKGGTESEGERLLDAVAVGSEAYRRKIKLMAGGGGRETTGKRELRRRVEFEEAVQAVERVKGVLRHAFLYRHGDWGPALVMWLARRYCGMKLQEIGDAMGGKDYAAVSDRLRRFEKRRGSDPVLAQAQKATLRILNLET